MNTTEMGERALEAKSDIQPIWYALIDLQKTVSDMQKRIEEIGSILKEVH
jgi:hypothetical protein